VDDRDDFEPVTVPSGDVLLHLVRSRPVPGERRAPVLMVHGFPDSHRTWSRQLEGLAPMHPVAAYDQRGVGRSTAPAGREGYAIARHLDDIAAAIDAVAGPEGQVHLVGHDWGGVLAWFFAGDPARAARLRSLSVLAAPHPGAANVQVTRRLRRHSLADLAFLGDQARKSWYALLFQFPWLPELYLRRDPVGTWIRAHRAGGVQRDDPELAEIDERLALSTLLPPLALYRQIAGHRAPPGPIPVPVCLVVPLRDLALSPGLYDNAAEFVPELEMHRIDDNHWVHRSRASEVNQILHDFIDRHDP
jgi:pimeloyl-ACP methyl ester carboxylesterase